MFTFLKSFLLLSVLIIAFAFPVSVQALDVQNVRFGVQSKDTHRLVLDVSGKTEFRVFALADPYRLVIDLPSHTWRVGAIDKPETGRVKALRQGVLNPEVSRIVFDMDTPIRINKAFFLPADGPKANRVVIDYARVSTSVFMQNKGKIFGKLQETQNFGSVSRSVSSTLESLPQDSSRIAAQKPVQSQTAVASNTGYPLPKRKPDLNPSGSQKTVFRKPLVVLDPGHGGPDPGALGPGGVHEKVIALALSKELRKQLEASGRYRVKMTRSDDRYIRLSDRVKFGRKHNADLFLSIHADSINRKNVKGASVYTLSEKASDKETAKLAARENKSDIIAGVDLGVEDQEVVDILMDLSMRDTMNQSKFLANTLVDKFQDRSVRLLQNPHRFAGFAVLKAPDVPSVLIEAGFMSNAQEVRRLNQPAYRRKLASAIMAGIDAYFAKVQKEQRS